MAWGELYDAIVTLPLLRSMVDLLLPKNLGFKVTPKGITSTKRTFEGITNDFSLTGFSFVSEIYQDLPRELLLEVGGKVPVRVVAEVAHFAAQRER